MVKRYKTSSKCKEGQGSKRGKKTKENQFKYADKGSTHTPGTLCTTPSVFSKPPGKPTFSKPSFHYQRVDNVKPNHVNALHEVGL